MSFPYMNNKIVMIAKDSAGYTGIADMAGKNIAVELPGLGVLERIERRAPHAVRAAPACEPRLWVNHFYFHKGIVASNGGATLLEGVCQTSLRHSWR